MERGLLCDATLLGGAARGVGCDGDAKGRSSFELRPMALADIGIIRAVSSTIKACYTAVAISRADAIPPIVGS